VSADPCCPPLRVLVVDDSAFMRTALRRMIESDPGLTVVGQAADGVEGVEKAFALRPDVITMDVEMPRLSGLDALSRIMEAAPCPVIMVSSLTRAHAEATLEALSRGAYDFLSKDLSYASLDIVRIKNDLVAKCKAAGTQRRRLAAPRPAPLPPPVPPSARLRHSVMPKLICIGASTGGPKALQLILPMLPAELPVPVAIVQHMPPGFTGPFARRLDSICRVRVKETEPNEPMLPGVVYIGAAGQHFRVLRRGTTNTVHLSNMPTNSAHIPSVDILMLSAADQLGQLAMGVILTGMGADGQHGMTAIYRAGGYTVGEAEHSCTVYGMPRACAEAGVLHSVLPLEAVPREMARATEAHAGVLLRR
jgi:two-component system chemotaxis response regulator CheB